MEKWYFGVSSLLLLLMVATVKWGSDVITKLWKFATLVTGIIGLILFIKSLGWI